MTMPSQLVTYPKAVSYLVCISYLSIEADVERRPQLLELAIVAHYAGNELVPSSRYAYWNTSPVPYDKIASDILKEFYCMGHLNLTHVVPEVKQILPHHLGVLERLRRFGSLIPDRICNLYTFGVK